MTSTDDFALPDLVPTRLALHRLAFYVVSSAREQATGKIGLRATAGGFGTPPFGADRAIRVEGTELVIEDGETNRRRPITTLGDAAEAVGVALDPDRGGEFDVPAMGAPTDELAVDEGAAALLAGWWALGTGALDRLRAQGGPDDEASEVQLWPEHFDAAIEMGAADAGARASYGASPGDDAHAEPYLYVAAWADVDRSDPFWNDPNFPGASVGASEITATRDPTGAALDFFLAGFTRLAGRS